KDTELAEVWKASEGLYHPFTAIFRLLILTGLRRNEVLGGRWDELDLETGLWTIPGSRMKAALPHEVPVPSQALAIVKDLPRIAAIPFMFPGRSGRKPIVNVNLAKARLDKATPTVAPWRIHDLRRTLRSALSRLKVAHEVGERVL